MKNTLILNLNDPRVSLENSGGKGLSLSRLISAGLPVPPGFVITTAAYQGFIEANQFSPQIEAALAGIDPEKTNELSAAAESIRSFFINGRVPDGTTAEIIQAYHSISGLNSAVVVRSSATAEDLPELSFAGQQDSYLNIQGDENLIDAVKRCWASLWTDRAIVYRLKNQVDHHGVSLAVVIQQLVMADAAGILFTANPIDRRNEEMLINASWGLGEAVVGGLVNPDTITLDRTSGKIIRYETADKSVMSVCTPTGTSEQPVPETLRKAQVLSAKDIDELFNLASQAENYFGAPQDMEWCLEKDRVMIVQSRPITTLAKSVHPSVEWKLPGGKGLYMRGSLVDMIPNPICPLFITLGLNNLRDNGLTEVFKKQMNADIRMPENYYVIINGYGYVGVSYPLKFWLWIMFRMIPGMLKSLKTVDSNWREEALPEYQSLVTRWSQSSEYIGPRHLWQGIQAVSNAAMVYVAGLLTSTMGSSSGAELLFNTVYEKLVRKEGDPQAAEFLKGFNSRPIQAEKMLYDLAIRSTSNPDLRAHLLDTPTEKLADGLLNPADSFPSGWKDFSTHLKTYLTEYGYAVYDLDFINPLPVDDPAPMFETIKMYIRGQGSNPHARQSAAEERRKQVSAVMLARTRGWKGWAFRHALRIGQTMAAVREDALAGIGLGYPLMRKLLAELGGILAGSGVIQGAGDIYWLEREEIDNAVQQLEKQETPSPMGGLVENRKMRYEVYKKLSPPAMLPERKNRLMGFQLDMFLPSDGSIQSGSIIKGIPASAGRVTAPARVLHGPHDFSEMRPGEVLVANLTTPAWTPLFAMAAAIVTDIGGPLSHGSIVAREYGIPAVLGTGVATHRIQTGQVITVDGIAGTVKINS